jgi:hypothetical protein
MMMILAMVELFVMCEKTLTGELRFPKKTSTSFSFQLMKVMELMNRLKQWLLLQENVIKLKGFL